MKFKPPWKLAHYIAATGRFQRLRVHDTGEGASKFMKKLVVAG